MIFSINDVVKKYVVRDSKANFYCSVNQHLSSTNYYENVLWATPPFVKHSFVIFRWFHLFFLSFLSFFLPSQTLKFYCVSAAAVVVLRREGEFECFRFAQLGVRSVFLFFLLRAKRRRRLLWMRNNMLPANKFGRAFAVACVAVCVLQLNVFVRLALSTIDRIRKSQQPTYTLIHSQKSFIINGIS